MPATISKSKGSTGPDVTKWQELLSAAGFATPATGTFGDATDAATRAWQLSKGLQADGVVGPLSWAAMTGVAPAVTPDKNAAFGRAALLEAWPSVTGEQPTLAELQIAGANARLESGYGKAPYKLLNHGASTPSKPVVLASSTNEQGGQGIHNWGAVQTSSGPPAGFLATDTSPLKKTSDNPFGYYDHHYKVYPTPAAGAAHMVEHMTKKRPTWWARMKEGDIDAWAEQGHAGFDSNGKLKVDPIPPIGSAPGAKGMPGYFEQNPASRAATIDKYVKEIAASLGEPIAAKRGGPMPAAVATLPSGTDAVPVPDAAGTFLPTLPAGTASVAKRGFLAALFAGAAWFAYQAWRRR